MIRYHINVNTGDADVTRTYYFVHEDHATITDEESDRLFDQAVKELNRVYKTYGRFATSVGVTRLFKSFGFDQTIGR